MNGRAGDCGAGVSAHQTVDRRDDRRHFGPADDAVAVNVVQVERPAQLVVHTSTRDHRQTRHKVLDTNYPISLKFGRQVSCESVIKAETGWRDRRLSGFMVAMRRYLPPLLFSYLFI